MQLASIFLHVNLEPQLRMYVETVTITGEPTIKISNLDNCPTVFLTPEQATALRDALTATLDAMHREVKP